MTISGSCELASPEQFEEFLLRTICEAAHSRRRAGFRLGFRQAIAAGLDGWAILFRRFQYWVDEDYQRVLVPQLCSDGLPELSFHEQSRRNRCALERLLEAHLLRRQADVLLDKRSHGYLDMAKGMVDRSASSYTYLVSDECCHERIKVVSLHSLGNLRTVQGRLLEGLALKQQVVFDWGKVDNDREQYYRASIRLAEEKGFAYAPPYNRLASVYWWRWVQANEEQCPSREQSDLLERSICYATRAIELAGGEYAPPYLIKAQAEFALSWLNNEEPDREAILDLLSKAVEVAPFDQSVRNELEDFALAVRSVGQRKVIHTGFDIEARLGCPVVATQRAIDNYLRIPEHTGVQRLDNCLVVLRRWSSFSPLLVFPERQTSGGGYYLSWGGVRVAIDPGVGFLRNLHAIGFSAWDLDAVVVTHQHIDHTADLEAILGCLKEYAKYAKDRKRNGEQIDKKKVDFLLSQSGMDRWRNTLLRDPESLEVLEEVAINLTESVAKGHPILIGDGQIEVRPVPVFNHLDMIDEGRSPPHATGVGLIITLIEDTGERTYTIGITSDTGYVTPNGERISEYYKDCDTVIMHISTVDDLAKDLPEDKAVRYAADISAPTFSGKFYKKHLGFWGTVAFVHDLVQPSGRFRKILLTEFGEEMLVSRPAVADEIRRAVASYGDRPHVWQADEIEIADIGTRLSLPRGILMCQVGENACTEPASKSREIELHGGDPTMPHRAWSDRAIVQVCERHARYLEYQGLAPFFGMEGMLWDIPRTHRET